MDANTKEGPYNKDIKSAVRWLKGQGIINRDKDIIDKTGYGKSTVSGYINGKVNASPDFRRKFEEVFELSLWDFRRSEELSIVEEPKVPYHAKPHDSPPINIRTASGKVIELILEGDSDMQLLNAFLEEREERHKDAELRAEKAEKEKDRLYSVIEQNLTALLKITGQIDANSKSIADDLTALITEVQADHRAIMDSVDVAAKLPIGTTRAKSGTVEIASHEELGKKGKKVTSGK